MPESFFLPGDVSELLRMVDYMMGDHTRNMEAQRSTLRSARGID
jgi:hypothetical protein